MTKSTLLLLVLLAFSPVSAGAQAEPMPPIGPYLGEWIHSFNRCETWQGRFLSEEQAMEVGAETYYEIGCGHDISYRSGWGSEEQPVPGPCGSSNYFPPSGIHHAFGVEFANMQVIHVRYGNPIWHCNEPWSQDGLSIQRVRSVECPDSYVRVGAQCVAQPTELIRPKNNDVCDSGLNDTNPISIGSGFKLQRDSESRFFGFLEFSRYYSSNTAFPEGRMGRQWRHALERRISVHLMEDGRVSLWVVRPNGNMHPLLVEDGQVLHDPDLRFRLYPLEDSDFSWLIVTSTGEQEFYDQDGLLQRLVLSGGRRLDLHYDQYALMAVVDESGRRVEFEYNFQGLLSAVVEPDGLRHVYGYSAGGLLEHVSLEGSATPTQLVRYAYEDDQRPHLLTAKFDALDRRVGGWAYDAQGRAYLSTAGSLESPVGRAEVLYGEGTAAVTGPLGNTTEYELDVLHGVPRITRASSSCLTCGGTSGSVGYDQNGFVAWREDLTGVRTEFQNNSRGLPEVQVDALGEPESRTIFSEWHTTLPLPLSRRVHDASGNLLGEDGWTYDEAGRVLAHWTNDPTGGPPRSSGWRYCSSQDASPDSQACPREGLLMAAWGPGQNELTGTRYSYFTSTDETGCATGSVCHRAGDLRLIESPAGHVVEILRYDAAGRVVAVRDANDVETRFDYHPRGWLSKRSILPTDGSEPSVSAVHYLDNGLIDFVELPDAAPIRFIYDDHQRLVAIDGGGLGRMDFVLDAAGNRIEESISDEDGLRRFQLFRTFNALGQLESWADALSNPTDFTYDANGNLASVVRPDQTRTDIQRDPLGRLREQIADAAGIRATTTVGYDALDRVTEVVDPKGLTTQYGFDALGDLTGLASPDTGTTGTTYDLAGNIASRIDARGRVLEFEHDAIGRVTLIAGKNEFSDSTFRYDESDSITGCDGSFPVGRLTRQIESFGESRWCYDFQGRPTRVTQTVGAAALQVDYDHGLAGRLAGVRYPSGHVLTYERDEVGRVVAVQWENADSGVTETLVSSVEYLPFGPPSLIAFGNGAAQYRPHDENYRPLGLQGGDGDLEFVLSEVGNIESILASAGGEGRHFEYDGLGRLLSVHDSAGVLLTEYTYDATGNRLSRLHHGQAEDYVYASDSHRLVSVGSVRRQYDASGNIANIDRGLMFNHDARSRLEAVASTRPRLSVHNTYNGFGQRVRKRGTDGERLFVYNLQGQLLGEYDAAGRPIQEYIWMDHLPVGVMVHAGGAYSGQLMAIYPDHLGTPRAVANQSGEVLWRWSLLGEPFGDHLPVEDVNGDGVRLTFNLRFPGQYFDQATGISYNYFRHYDATVGRYLQSDPIGLAGGVSTYAYVGGDPLSYVDPYGLWRMPQWARDIANGTEGQLGASVSAFGLMKGGTLSVYVGVSTQGVTVNLQGCGGVGGGAFIGASGIAGAQRADPCEARRGTRTSVQGQVEGGAGLVGGATVDTGGSGGTASLGARSRVGGGVGKYIAVMHCTTNTWMPLQFGR